SFVELLIQERAYFKDRKRPTYFEHREINVQRWRQVYRELIAAGRMRDIPVEQITNVVSNVLYGIMVTNFFNGQPKPSDVQAKEIVHIVFLGVLHEPERQLRLHGASVGPTDGQPKSEPETAPSPVSDNELFGGMSSHESTLVDDPRDPLVGECCGD